MPKRQLVPHFKLNEKGLARFFDTLEARIMDAVWTLEQVTVQNVCDHLGGQHNYKTMMTVMNRLYEKELLRRERISHAFVYHPRLSRDEFVQGVSRDVFAGLVRDFGDVALAQFVNIMDELDLASFKKLQGLIAQRAKGAKP
jgi:predicted transcriptional regulator